MDVLSHGLWGNIFVYKKLKNEPKQRWLAVVFGMLPDIIPFAPSFIYTILSRQEFMSIFLSSHWTVRFAAEAYNYTHSLVIFSLVASAVFLLKRGKFYWPLLAWGIHILMDIPTHPDFYQTPFLFPLSEYKVTFGASWAAWWIFIPNWTLIILWYAWWYFKGRRKA